MAKRALAPQPRLLRVEEAAQMLAISRASLYRLIARRQVRSVRLGNTRRIPTEEVERLVREGAPSSP